MDIPSPDVVLLEAQYEDPQAETWIRDWGIDRAIRYYRGGPVYWDLPDDMYERKRIFADSVISRVNYRLNQDGWEFSQACFGGRYMFKIDRYVPPTSLWMMEG